MNSQIDIHQNTPLNKGKKYIENGIDLSKENKYVKNNKIDVLNTTYVFGIIIPKNYKLQNISINSRLSIGITCRILSSLNLKYYIDFIPQV